jgi:uncharacterized protein (UPF0332 family)/predicted nucleotidyltransferase
MAELLTADPVLRRFDREIERLFPGRVRQVILYGSRARGEHRADSDYDLAVVVAGDRPDTHPPELTRLQRDLYEQTGAEIRAWIATPRDIAQATLFAHHLRRDGFDIRSGRKIEARDADSAQGAEMDKIVASLMRYARESLDTAKATLRIDLPHVAARESYMAVYHAAQALIFARTGAAPKTHSGVNARFNDVARHLPGLPRDLVDFVNGAYKFKERADYHTGEPIGRSEAEAALGAARRTVAAIASMLE